MMLLHRGADINIFVALGSMPISPEECDTFHNAHIINNNGEFRLVVRQTIQFSSL
jgi:hypothetical protein